MALNKLNEIVLICGNSPESIDVKNLLKKNNVKFVESPSQYDLLILSVPNTESEGRIFRGYEKIEDYVNSKKVINLNPSKKNSQTN